MPVFRAFTIPPPPSGRRYRTVGRRRFGIRRASSLSETAESSLTMTHSNAHSATFSPAASRSTDAAVLLEQIEVLMKRRNDRETIAIGYFGDGSRWVTLPQGKRESRQSEHNAGRATRRPPSHRPTDNEPLLRGSRPRMRLLPDAKRAAADGAPRQKRLFRPQLSPPIPPAVNCPLIAYGHRSSQSIDSSFPATSSALCSLRDSREGDILHL